MEEAVRALAEILVRMYLGTVINTTHYKYIKDCHPMNEYVKWADYEGNAILHSFKCKRGNQLFECIKIIVLREAVKKGESITICYHIPPGLVARLKSLSSGACPGDAQIL